MTAHDMLAQARQGNPWAIAAILNHLTRPKEITTNVTKNKHALTITFSADRLPNQTVMTGFVQRSIQQLGIGGIDTVQIMGRRVGDEPAEWRTEIYLPSPEKTGELTLDEKPSDAKEELISDEKHFDREEELIPDEKHTDSKQDELLSRTPSENGLPSTPVAIATPVTTITPTVSTTEITPVNSSSPNGQVETVTATATPAAIDTSDSASLTATKNQALQDLADSPILRKPEVVVLLVFVLVLIFWQTYLSIIERAAPEGSLNGRELARRLSVSYSTISRRKHRDDFSQWSQALDPDGITWVYTEGVFVPQL